VPLRFPALDQAAHQPFRPRAPWLNGDLQTLRDSLRPAALPPECGTPLTIGVGGGDQLLALLDRPIPERHPLALVLLLHGLGGSSDREGLRRMGLTLQRAGFAVLRINLRGAGPGRQLARGTYAARCNSDLLPVITRARQLAAQLGPPVLPLPLLGVGLSLGGTKLLNALLAGAQERRAHGLDACGPLFDGLVCISSPLDLEACSRQIDRPRNRLYRSWLLRRLVQQTLADPFGFTALEREALEGRGPLGRLRSIRDFDAAITAPRWGYADVEAYYRQASPIHGLLAALEPAEAAAASDGRPVMASALPSALILHADDDPWVPVAATQALARAVPATESAPPLQVLITAHGGHNGFHGRGDTRAGVIGNWADRLTARWLRALVGAEGGSVNPGGH